MDILDQACRWHRRFAAPLTLADGTQLLLSETETLLLPPGAVTELSTLLSSGTPLSRKLSGMPMAAMPALMATWQHLRHQGHVQSEQDHAQAAYLEPDFRQPMADAPEAAAWGWCWSLSSWGPAARLHERSDLLPANWPATLVVCDDLLDPRLARVADWHRTHQRAWVPVRLVGEQAMVGPLFGASGTQDSQRTPAPCWHCLSHRLRQQQPGRCIDLSADQPPRAVPLAADPELFERRLLRAVRRAQQALEDREAFVRTWVDGEGGQRHRLVQRPTCPVCGDAGLQSRLQSRPMRLQSRTLAPHAPGGTRVSPPERLLAQRDALVSSLLGPIAEVTPIHAPANDILPVHRSRFMRPFTEDAMDEAPSFIQVCLGKGRTAAQSQASAMGEAIERLSAIYRGDEAIVQACARDLGDAAVPAASSAARADAIGRPHARAGRRPHGRRFTAWALVSGLVAHTRCAALSARGSLPAPRPRRGPCGDPLDVQRLRRRPMRGRGHPPRPAGGDRTRCHGHLVVSAGAPPRIAAVRQDPQAGPGFGATSGAGGGMR
ncbi:MAG: TOMM precursor leader peptide-binding protein [Aquabacterium sp.]